MEASEANISRRARELFDKGLVAMERDNLPYAMDMFMAVLETEPRFLKCRKFLRATSIKFMNESKKGGKAFHITAILSNLPALVRGRMALRAGDALRALGIAEKLLRLDPLNMTFVRLLCDAARKAEIQEAAIHTLNVMREYYQQDIGLLYELGNLYLEVNQPDEARKCFESITELRPNDGRALQALKNAMARDTMLKGGWDEAAKDGGSYRSIIKDAKEAAVLEADNKAVRDEQNVELLIRDTEAKVKREPDNINYRRALARLYVQINRFDDAVRMLEEGRRAAGSDPQLDQALTDIKLKQYDAEIAQCKENGDAAGMAAKEKEKRDFHFKSVQTRVARYPNDLPLRFEFGRLLYENDQYNEAIQHFQLAQRNPKFHIQTLYYLGVCFLRKEQFDLAKEQLEKAAEGLTEMNDLKKEIFYQLGALLEKTGDFEQAANRYYKEIYQADIGFRDVAAKIEQSYQKK
ncbi:MAG: tetratricopeptide repeat protein [Kiritimatiellae bacterium]|jgi:tetratricopeptide (TPR) repeat protein|nr:tetratricopeptide repeat protein [Kiritimatiellia bacterium]